MSDDEDTKRNDRRTTSTGASYDGETGEVHDVTPRRRRRELTPEEQAVVDERAARKRLDSARLVAVLEALSPGLVTPADPPLRELGRPLRDVSRAREAAPLLRLPRLSGSGGPGSALVASERDYDGDNEGAAGPYVLLHVEYHDGQAFRCRTRGVRLLPTDLPPVALALAKRTTSAEMREMARDLMAYADELDARDEELAP